MQMIVRSAAARWLVGLSCSLALLAVERAAHAQPDTRGPLAVQTWSVGDVTLDGVAIKVYAHYPTGAAGPMPVAAVVHGASRYAAVMGTLADTLASRGIVALAPTIPCNLTGCDHEANARQLRALLEWGVAQSADPSSKLHGLVDGTRRAVIGHSWGGLASFLAARDDPAIGTVVILDANDDKEAGKAAAPLVAKPSVHVMAEKIGACNDKNWKETVYPLTQAPHLRVVVTGAAHCDVEDPTDGLCKYACGSGDASLAYLFRRYAVAWAACLLQGDATMASWLGGSDLAADTAAGRVQMVTSDGLASLPCMGGAPDGGAPDGGGGTDAGPVDTGPDIGGETDAGIDAGAEPDAGGGPDDAAAASDAGGTVDGSLADAGVVDGGGAGDAHVDATVGGDLTTGADAGEGGGASSGCSCAAIGL